MENKTAEHYLKTWPEYFEEVLSGRKPFELRFNDRNFQVGDTLILKEWNPKGYSSVSPNTMTGEYTGREIRKTVTYILQGNQFGLLGDYVVMGLADQYAAIQTETLRQENERLRDENKSWRKLHENACGEIEALKIALRNKINLPSKDDFNALFAPEPSYCGLQYIGWKYYREKLIMLNPCLQTPNNQK